jgi:hypothetical protein
MLLIHLYICNSLIINLSNYLYKGDLYANVMDASQLSTDLLTLPHADYTR